MVFQDAYGSLNPRQTVGAMLAEALRVHRLRERAAIPGRTTELLALVGPPADAAARHPRAFTGGHRQRIANVLLGLQARLKLTILFVAHDLRLVRHLSHRTGSRSRTGPRRRARRDGGAVRASPAPLHASTPRRGAHPRPDPARRRAPGGARRAAEPARDPGRVPVPPAPPARLRPLPGGSGSAACHLVEAPSEPHSNRAIA